MGVAVSVQPGPRRPRRIGDEERRTCAEQLATHYAAGRLSPEEFEERLGIALTAQTAGELGRILIDLPFPQTAYPRQPSPPSVLARRYAWVGSGVVLLVAASALLIVLVSGELDDDDAAAVGAGIACVLGIVATLLVIRGVLGGWSSPVRRHTRSHDQ
jgi:hypothetical protein